MIFFKLSFVLYNTVLIHNVSSFTLSHMIIFNSYSKLIKKQIKKFEIELRISNIALYKKS